MSLKSDWQKSLFLIVCGIFAGAGYYAYEKIADREAHRDTSSFTSKIDLNQNSEKWSHLLRKPAGTRMALGKAGGLFQVDITSKSQEAAQEGDIVELTGTILPHQNIASADITWVLFKGFEIISGQQTQTLSNLQVDEPVEVNITLKKIGSEDSVIHLSIDTDMNGVKIGSGGSFSTKSDLGKGAIEKDMKAQKLELLETEGHETKILQ
jgi:hypothetical protein